MTTRSVLTACVTVLLFVAASLTGAQAQEPFVPELRDGDVVWTFANEEPFYDSRVAGALAALMTDGIEAKTPAGVRIVRVESDGPGYVAATQYAASEVEPLLAAAGFDPALPFELIGTCRYWTPETRPDETGIPWGTPDSPASIVISAFNDALRELGVQPAACEGVDDPGDAHIVFWQWGEDAPVPPMRPSGTLLAGTAAALGPTTGGTGDRGGTGGGDVAPAGTGNAGLTDDGKLTIAMAATAATVLLVLAARRSTSSRWRWREAETRE